MANKNKNADAAGTETATAEGQEGKQKKAKKERIFSSSLGLTEVRKKEQKLNQSFNRLGRTVKDMGLSPENQQAILDILGKEYEEQAAKIFTPSANGK